MICFDSKAIGDTLAWFPYVEEFRKKHECEVVISTFHNEWFENNPEYKNIKFVKPEESVNSYVHYKIGWFKTNGKWDKGKKNKNMINKNIVLSIFFHQV